MWRTIGQSHAITLLESGLRAGNLSHAYLFIGPSRVGKTTLALDLAQALNCQGIEPPCGECKSCQRIVTGKHTDVTIIGLAQPSAKNRTEGETHVEISIDDIRELQHGASLPPFEGRWKVFIIDGAENLSLEAANCLLKVLEEPPPRVMILLLAENEAKLLPTVISRCQRLELKPISNVEVEKVLVNSGNVEGDRAKLLARLSEGCLGWAIVAATDNAVLQQRTQRLSALFPLLGANWEERFGYVAQIAGDRELAEEVLKLWLTWWRDVMLVKWGCGNGITNVDAMTIIEEWTRALSMEEIRDFIGSLQRSLEQIGRNANVRLVLEVLMLDMPKKEGSGRGAIAMPVSQ